MKKNGIRAGEIISDYSSPRPGNREDCCRPGEWGYNSLIPSHLKKNPVWVKCMNSPVWIRGKSAGSKKTAVMPLPDPEKFTRWLTDTAGKPGEVRPVVIGLTIDCCVLSTVQELSWRGYRPIVLKEGVDAASGKIKERDAILNLVIKNWAEIMTWPGLKKLLEHSRAGGI